MPIIELANPQDQPQLHQILRQVAVGTTLQAYKLCREPDFCRLLSYQGHQHRVLVVRASESSQRLLGLMTLILDHVYLDGIPRQVAYTGDLRLLPQARGQGLGDALMQRAILLARELGGDEIPVFTCVAADNAAGLRKNQLLAESLGLQMQELTLLNACFFPAMPLPLRKPSGFKIRLANAEDLPTLAALWAEIAPQRHLSRYYSHWMDNSQLPPLQPQDWLLAEYCGKLIGFMGLWQQQALRQVYLTHTPLPLRLLGQKSEQPLNIVHGLHLCLLPRYRNYLPEIIKHSLKEVRKRGALLLSLALDTQDPLNDWLPISLGRSSQLRLLSSYVPTKTYPYHVEMSLG